MRARLDCEAKYVVEQDPWGIGDADSPRYDLYVEAIRARARKRGSVLDIGCGFGAMLARMRPDFERLHGIELSADAVAKGGERYPFIELEQGSIDALQRTRADREHFDAIIFSDVIYYVDEAGRRASLRWIAEHLHRDGFAFIAAYSPGGKEFTTPRELCTLVERELVIERAELLASDHLILLARPRRRLAALTLDYETWQPVPAGRRIDWNADVLQPTDALLDACDAEDARLTIFAELGEHAFLREHEPQVAARMEAQWRDAAVRGHDVQMHLHPSWLPELGARSEGGRYMWNELLWRIDDHPDLLGLIGRLKRTLEEIVRPVDPSYETVAFRAGGWEAQPFRRLAEALLANDLWCDSSVYHGGRQPGVYHDYSCPFDTHQPWFASHVDPQLMAPPAERGIVELPAATFARNDRWTFDTEEGARFGDRLLGAIEAERTAGASTEASRLIATVRGLGDAAYQLTRSRRALVNRMLPRRVAHTLADYPGMRLVEDDFYVAVGHSKADLDIPAIREQMRVLRESGVEVVRLAEMARIARGQLELGIAPAAENDAREQLRRAHPAAPRLEDGDARSQRLQAMIPVDRPRVLHLEVADLPSIPFADGAFDCVCADDVLERAFDVDAALAEIRRVLADDGLLLAAIAPDAYGTRRIAEDHTWKTSAADVCERLGHAGFLDVSVEEADTYPLGAAPYPPSLDRLLHIQAWRRAVPLAPVDRVDALLHWTHEHCDPAGRTERAGMTLVLGDALTRERYEPRLVTMLARDHPRGRGPSLEETHAAIELTLPDRSLHVLDPMADVRFPCALRALIDDAALARDVERERDPSFLAHGYHLYASPFWYRRVVAVAACSQLREPHRFVPARWADHATEADYQALAFARTRAWRGLRRLRPA